MRVAESAVESENTLSESVEQNQPFTSSGAINLENTVKTFLSLPRPLYDPLPSDPHKWLDIVSDAQIADIVKKGSYQFL